MPSWGCSPGKPCIIKPNPPVKKSLCRNGPWVSTKNHHHHQMLSPLQTHRNLSLTPSSIARPSQIPALCSSPSETDFLPLGLRLPIGQTRIHFSHVFAHVCTWVSVCVSSCVCERPHASLSSSAISTRSAHTPHLRRCRHPLPPHLIHPLRTSPATHAWMSLPHENHRPGLRRPGEVQAPWSSKLITRRWACLFAWHASVSDCFIHPLSQLKTSQFILPSRRDEIGGTRTHSQKPNIDFQLSFNFAPVFICSFHFFQTD